MGHFIEIELEKHRYVNFDIYPSSRSVPIRRRRILPVRCCPARSIGGDARLFLFLYLSLSLLFPQILLAGQSTFSELATDPILQIHPTQLIQLAQILEVFIDPFVA